MEADLAGHIAHAMIVGTITAILCGIGVRLTFPKNGFRGVPRKDLTTYISMAFIIFFFSLESLGF